MIGTINGTFSVAVSSADAALETIGIVATTILQTEFMN